MMSDEIRELVDAMNKKKKGWFSKVVVLLVIVLNILFTMKVFDIMEQGFQEPTALIAAWFGFTTVELWSLASIKKRKEAKEEAKAVAKAVNQESMN